MSPAPASCSAWPPDVRWACRAKLLIFVALSVAGAFLTVATPVLASQVVIVARVAVNTIVWLAVVIALVAVADAAVSLVTH